jgi:hypothetical protein
VAGGGPCDVPRCLKRAGCGVSRSIRDRVDRLEAQREPFQEEDAARRYAIATEFLDEVAGLKFSRAAGFRGGVPIEPEDIPGKLLGTNYTWGQLVRLAVRRVFERKGLVGDEHQELIQDWTRGFEKLSTRSGRERGEG